MEAIQCPKCGSPLEVDARANSAVCTYCGSYLRLTQGPSGHVLPVLDDIKVDTGILARDTARRRFEQRLEELHDARQALLKNRETRKRLVGDLQGWLVVGIGTWIVLIMVGLRGYSLIVVSIGFTAVFLLLHQRIERKKREIDHQYAPRLEHNAQEIASIQQRVRIVSHEMDRLTEEL